MSVHSTVNSWVGSTCASASVSEACVCAASSASACGVHVLPKLVSGTEMPSWTHKKPFLCACCCCAQHGCSKGGLRARESAASFSAKDSSKCPLSPKLDSSRKPGPRRQIGMEGAGRVLPCCSTYDINQHCQSRSGTASRSRETNQQEAPSTDGHSLSALQSKRKTVHQRLLGSTT